MDNCKKITLSSHYGKIRDTYAEKYGLDSWQWKDEGIPNAILDYLSMCGEFAAEDIAFARREGIWGECLWCLADDGRETNCRDFEIREDTDDDGSAAFDVYEQLVGDSEHCETFRTREEAENWIAGELAKDLTEDRTEN